MRISSLFIYLFISLFIYLSIVHGSTSFIIKMSGIIPVTCPVEVLVYRLVISSDGNLIFLLNGIVGCLVIDL